MQGFVRFHLSYGVAAIRRLLNIERIGSLKGQVSCAEYRLFHRDLLQKRPICLRSLLIVATPYGVATISRLLKMIGLFCKRALYNRRYSAKETYYFEEPTNRSHPTVRTEEKLSARVSSE